MTSRHVVTATKRTSPNQVRERLAADARAGFRFPSRPLRRYTSVARRIAEYRVNQTPDGSERFGGSRTDRVQTEQVAIATKSERAGGSERAGRVVDGTAFMNFPDSGAIECCRGPRKVKTDRIPGGDARTAINITAARQRVCARCYCYYYYKTYRARAGARRRQWRGKQFDLRDDPRPRLSRSNDGWGGVGGGVRNQRSPRPAAAADQLWKRASTVWCESDP